jgi:hypothetical protein
MKPDRFGDFLVRFLGVSGKLAEATRPPARGSAPPAATELEEARRLLFELRGEARQLIVRLGEEAAAANGFVSPYQPHPKGVVEAANAAFGGALGSELSAARAMPILSHGRRPSWWQDTEVAVLVTRLHRLVEIGQAVAICRERFGDERSPSKSSLHRYWKKLDALARESGR